MSIKNKVTILFIISLVLIAILSFWIKQIDQEKNQKIIISNYLLASREILPTIVEQNEKKQLQKLNELHLKKRIEAEGSVIFKQNLAFGYIEILKSKDYYLKINYLDEEYFFEDTKPKDMFEHEYIVKLLFLIDILILIVIYLAILKIISPINKLSKKLHQFAHGYHETHMPETGAKEIVELSKNFNNMANSIKENINDRENLLRFFGHEIRTPLAKAKFALVSHDAKLIEDSLKQIEIFVDEVLNLHLITDTNLDKSTFKVQTLIIEALNKTKVLKEEDIVIDIDDFSITGDLYYLSITLKNLIDNALKYSTKLPIIIRAKNNQIKVISYGEKLDKEFSYYIKPFTKRFSTSFGLGLSLVDLIIEKHKFKFSYEHNSNQNIFIINIINIDLLLPQQTNLLNFLKTD